MKKKGEAASSKRMREQERRERPLTRERERERERRENRTRGRRGACVSLYEGHARERASESTRLNEASGERRGERVGE